jgi:hypothetical protein
MHWLTKIETRGYNPKLKQNDINCLNRLITTDESKAVIKSLPSKKCPGTVGCTCWILWDI